MPNAVEAVGVGVGVGVRGGRRSAIAFIVLVTMIKTSLVLFDKDLHPFDKDSHLFHKDSHPFDKDLHPFDRDSHLFDKDLHPFHKDPHLFDKDLHLASGIELTDVPVETLVLIVIPSMPST